MYTGFIGTQHTTKENIMHIITVKTLSQAANVREFLQDRAELSFNKDFTVRIGATVNIPETVPYATQIMWKFLDDNLVEE